MNVAAKAQFRAGELATAPRDRDEAYADADKAWADAAWPAWATYVGVEASANAQWVDTESHAYAGYEQDVAAAQVALVSAIAPANVTYAHDVAQAWADYNVTMTGIGRDMYIASAQLNVAQVNAADPSTFSYLYPQSGGGYSPMMGGISALLWTAAFGFVGVLEAPQPGASGDRPAPPAWLPPGPHGTGPLWLPGIGRDHGCIGGNYVYPGPGYPPPNPSGLELLNLPPRLPPPPTPQPVPLWRLDVNKDDKINVIDVLLEIEKINSPPDAPLPDLPYDVNQDGKVDAKDVIEIINAINAMPPPYTPPPPPKPLPPLA